MRKLMWFAVGFAAACAAGAYLIFGTWLFVLAGIFGVLALLFALARTNSVKIPAVVLLGCVAGLLYMGLFDMLYLSAARGCDGQTVAAQLEVTDYSQETEYGYYTDGRLCVNGKTFRTTLYSSGEALNPGDLVTGNFKLQFTVSQGQDSPTYHQGKGIFLLARPAGELEIDRCEKLPLKYFAAYMRRQIQNALDNCFPEGTLGFARALLLGDSSKLSEKDSNDFSVSGIRHVIAVSGLHVSILFSLVYVFTGRKNLLNVLVGFPVLFLFAAIAGFTPSIVRACVMQGLMILALCIDKEYDPPTALAFSVIVILAVNPLAVTSVSFQLSVGCTLGILLFSRKIHDYFMDPKRLGPAKGNSLKSKLIRWFVSGVSVTLSAMVFTTPLCAWYFGMVSLVSVVTNLLTLWVISLIFYLVMLAGVLSAVWLPLGKIVAAVVSVPIRYVQIVAGVMADIPYAAVYTQDIYILAWLTAAYLLLVVFFFCKKKRPLLLAGCMAVSLMVCIGFSKWEGNRGDFSVTVLDVGQGQCVLIQSEEESYLVDCGGDSGSSVADTVAKTMAAYGIEDIDGIILTHYDSDHANGILPLLELAEVERLYLPDSNCETDMKDRLLAQTVAGTSMVSQDMEVELPTAVLRIFAPAKTKNENDDSLCILFQAGNYDILITGDRAFSGEEHLMERTDLPKLEVLIVGHHGSGSSTSLELLRATRPDEAVISVGKNNKFGHPAQEALMRLEMFGCRIWRTDISGNIRFRG